MSNYPMSNVDYKYETPIKVALFQARGFRADGIDWFVWILKATTNSSSVREVSANVNVNWSLFWQYDKLTQRELWKVLPETADSQKVVTL